MRVVYACRHVIVAETNVVDPDPFVHGPTNAWQDATLRKLKANASGASADVEPFCEGLTEDPTTPTTVADETVVGVREASTPPRT